MKKITILLAILALAFLAVPAFALNNTVVNGDFQTGTLAGWTQVDNLLHDPFFIANAGTNYYARSTMLGPLLESSMYQVVDASTSDGWLAAGTSESFDFKFDYRRPDGTSAEYGIFYSSAAVAPAFGSLDSPGAGWTLISEVDTEPGLARTSLLDPCGPWATIEITGTLVDQPRWFAIAFEGRSIDGIFQTNFDNVSLTTQCVPVPPSMLLLGSGLLGLGILRFRKGTC
ncbi:MAG: hypothetical protein ACYC6G_05885 [Desulfobaccales bacterium]